MIFSINIATGNAAFHEDDEADTFAPEDELARILHELAGRLGSDTRLTPEEPIRLFDVNGNRVGFAVLSEEVTPA